MSKRLPVSRQQLLDPEGFEITRLLDLARAVMRRVLLRRRIDTLSVQAAAKILEHYEPKPTFSATINGPVVIRWDLSSPEIPPVSARMELRSMSSDGSNGSAFSSVIEDGERPPSA